MLGRRFWFGFAVAGFAASTAVGAQSGSKTAAQTVDVIPAPAHVELHEGRFTIRSGTPILTGGDPQAVKVARYFAELMQKTRGISLVVDASGAARRVPHAIVLKLDARSAADGLQVISPASGGPKRRNPAVGGPAVGGPPVGGPMRRDPAVGGPGIAGPGVGGPGVVGPEAYAVDITSERALLSARDPRGLLYAAVTLWQLCTATQSHENAPADLPAAGLPAADLPAADLPAVKIVDSPRFAWRGLMLDSARHYQSPEFIMQLIDWMSLHKLNVLHWHLTDDQAWRLEIRRYPRLTGVGAWRVPAGAAPAADIDAATGHPRLYGGFYSQDTVRRIVAHALERNITIVPEIDMPGHATAAVVAYPRLASIVPAPAVVPSDWGVFTNLYNADESTFEFLENVLAEVVRLFPGKYVHIGGDEAVKKQWKASPHVQARMRELGVSTEEALQSYFVARMSKFLGVHHRRLIGWDEILEGSIAPDATVMSWRGIDGALAAAAKGHDTVLSPAPTLYFDNRQSSTDTQPGREKVISLQDVYQFDPQPASLPADQRHHVLGLQANVWTEHMRTEQRVEYMTFPRVAAVAEVGWSALEKRDWDGFRTRMPSQMSRYAMLGIHAYSENDALVATPRSDVPRTKRSSHQLATCTKAILLSLEDDAPLVGDRETFMLDIMNPCWIYKDADLTRVTDIEAAVGQLPFNFQLGAEPRERKLYTPQTPEGELEVRIDGCDGQRIAVLPLKPAVTNNGVTELPAAKINHREGTHDLCLRFAQPSQEPMWVLDWVQFAE